MDKYLKLQAIQGMVFGLRIDLAELDESDFKFEDRKREIVDKYFGAIQEIVSENPYQ